MLLTRDQNLVIILLKDPRQSRESLLTLLSLLLDSLCQESFKDANGLTQHYFVLFLTYTMRLVHFLRSLAQFLGDKQ